MVSKRPRILIVDDDEGTRRSLALILSKKGYETETAGTGREALDKAWERAFNLALLDIRLPDMEGVDLIAHLKATHPDMAVIMITGHASVKTAVQALDEGALAYITKPLDVDRALAVIKDALDKQRLLREKLRAESQRDAMLEALRESEQRYRAIFENTGTATVIIDQDMTISLANSEFEDLSGYSRGELEGKKRWTDFVVADDLERMKGLHLLRRTDPKAAPRRYEFQLVSRGGDVKDILLSVDLITGTGQSVASLLDITDRKRAESQRDATLEALQQHTQQLETLQAVTAALSTSLSLDEVLQLILEKLAVVATYDSAAIFLTEGDDLRCVISMGHPHPDQVVGQIFPADNELIQEMLVSKQPFYLADAQADSRFRGWGDADYVRGWLGAPLLARGEMIGYLSIDSRRPDAYGPRQVALVQPFADQAAQAIENARLHGQAQRHAAELEGRVAERTAELRQMVNLMAGREVRMAELKDVIRELRAQLEAAGMEPAADDPLGAG